MRPGRIIGCADRAGGVAEELAVLAYLVKPVRDSELAAAIEMAVARFEEWRELEREAKSLQEALAARQVVERAKRLLMSRYGLTEREAFMGIHRPSRRSRMPMREVAEEILRE